MKKILYILIFIFTSIFINAQDINFTNLYGNGASEPQFYHISNTYEPLRQGWVLDMTWWAGVNLFAPSGDIKLNSTGGTLQLAHSGKVGIGINNPTSNLELRIPASGETITGMSIDVAGFNTIENLNRSTYFQVRDLGSSSPIPFIIKGSGNIGIGVNNPQDKLDVNGTIHAKEVKIDLNGWADFVFKPSFDLPTLEEVEKHIQEKGHLPNVPSEKEVLENGVNLGDNQKLLLQKIEELTLYSIEQNKLNKIQTNEIKTQSEKIQQLESENTQIKSLLERVEKLLKNKN